MLRWICVWIRGRTAQLQDIVNGYEERELYRIIRDYGEDKFAKNIAKHIVAARKKAPIRTTGELTEIIRQSIPMKSTGNGRTSCQEDFSGNPDRTEPGTGCSERFPGWNDRSFE